MATLTVRSTSRAGYDTAGADSASATDKFTNDGKTLFYVENTDSGSHTLTMQIQETVDSQAVTPRTLIVAAGKKYILGPFDKTVYNDNLGFAHMDWNTVTGVKVFPFKLGA